MKRYLIFLSVFVLISACAGVKTVSDADSLSIASGMAAMDLDADYSIQEKQLLQAISSYKRQQHELSTAEEEKTPVSTYASETSGVYMSPEQVRINALQVQWNGRKNVVFTCKYWNDSNGDGFMTFNEFVGIGNVFDYSDKAILVVRIVDHKADPLIAKTVYSPKISTGLSQALLDGKEAKEDQLVMIEFRNYIHTIPLDKRGTYNFTFYAGNDYIGRDIIVIK